jgi:hypothetical protein
LDNHALKHREVHMFKRSLVGLGIGAGVALVAVSAIAQERPVNEDPMERQLAGDLFVTGSVVRLQKAVKGDLFAGGGNVSVRAEVQGDAVAAGGDVRLEGPVKQGGIYAAGGRVRVNTEVNRNVRLAGGSVELGQEANIHGNASLVGGQIDVLGAVDGYVQVGGGRVFINGPVRGDVHVTARELELGPDAKVGGKLTYLTQAALKRDAAAVVTGGTERLEQTRASEQLQQYNRSAAMGARWVWTVGLMVLAACLVALLPGVTARVSGSIEARPWFDLLLGFISLACIPAFILVLFVTIIGLPIALLVVMGYLALLLVGYVATGIAVGEITLKHFQPVHANQRSWQVGAAVIGVLVVASLGRVPLLGGLLGFVALLLGIGAVASQFWRKRVLSV